MRKLILARAALAVFLLVCWCVAVKVFAGDAGTEAQREEVVKAARRSFEGMVLSWRDQDYESLYEFGTLRSRKRLSREDFSSRMRMAKQRLACCWATVREVRASYESPERVYLEATVGYRLRQPVGLRPRRSLRPVEDSFFERETFYLVLEEGRWRVNLFRILEKSSK